MKKLKALLPLLLIVCLLCACSEAKEESNDLVDSYKRAAQKFLDSGDLASAQAALEEGISRTGDASLEKMLSDLLAEDTTEPTTEEPTETTTEPTTAVPTEETTEPTTAAPTETTVESARPGNGGNMTNSFDASDWYSINVFLSNFSEQGFGTLDSNDSYALVKFAYLHNKINNPSSLAYDADSYCYIMTAEVTDQTLYRFFGHTIAHDTHSKTYPGGYTDTIDFGAYGYYFPAASGEFYGYLSIASEMYDNGDGTYLVYFDVYELDWDTYNNYGISSDYYYLSSAEAATNGALKYCYSGSAQVCDYDGGSYTSYQVLSYNVD